MWFRWNRVLNNKVATFGVFRHYHSVYHLTLGWWQILQPDLSVNDPFTMKSEELVLLNHESTER